MQQKEYEYTGKAMGTDFSIAIVCDSEALANAQAEQAILKIHSYEARFSRFIPESELSLLNTHKEADVSDTFLEVLQESLRLFTLTKGVFNPLVQIERLGYDTDFDLLEGHEEATHEEEYNIDFSETAIDLATQHVVLASGQKLDFGGFLKGYLATLLADEIMRSSDQVTGVIVNIGGDISTRGVDEDKNVFTFTIYNPVLPSHDITIPLRDTSLATSGTYKRAWKHNGENVHHILDSTGTHNPGTNIVSASIIHAQGGTAEAYTKMFLSIGPEKAGEILGDMNTPHIIITTDGTVTSNML